MMSHEGGLQVLCVIGFGYIEGSLGIFVPHF